MRKREGNWAGFSRLLAAAVAVMLIMSFGAPRIAAEDFPEDDPHAAEEAAALAEDEGGVGDGEPAADAVPDMPPDGEDGDPSAPGVEMPEADAPDAPPSDGEHAADAQDPPDEGSRETVSNDGATDTDPAPADGSGEAASDDGESPAVSDPAPTERSEEAASDDIEGATDTDPAPAEDSAEAEPDNARAEEFSETPPEEEPPAPPEEPSAEARAAAPLLAANAGDYITKLTVAPSLVENYGKVRVEVAFSDGSPDEHVFHGGDTIAISWPTAGDGVLKGYSATIPLISQDGVTYGEVKVTPAGAAIVFNAPVNDLYDVNGSFYFELLALNNADTTEEDTQIATIVAGSKTADVSIHKAASGTTVGGDLPDFRKQADSIGGGYTYVEGKGWVMSLDPEDPTYTQWILTANENHQEIRSDIVISDSIGAGQRLDKSFLYVYSDGNITSSLTGSVDSVTASWNAAHPNSRLSLSDNGGLSWRIDQATATGTYWCMVYRCEITDFSQAYYENAADIYWTAPDGTAFSAHDEASFANVSQGGDVTGLPRGVLQVTKRVEGTQMVVSGVTFVIERSTDEG